MHVRNALKKSLSVSATAVIGAWLIPTCIEWVKSRKQVSRLNSYHKDMTSLFKDGNLDLQDITGVDLLYSNIADEYSKGKLSNEQYINLKNEISVLYEEIYRTHIDSFQNSPDFDANSVDRIRDEITDAYSKGKITELHYDLLNERLSKMTSKNDTQNSV